MDSAMRPARLAVILGTVCALGAGAPAIALAAESPAPVVARQDAGASDLTTLTISEDAGLELPDPDVPEEGDGFVTSLSGNYTTFGNGRTVKTADGLWVASSGGDYMVRWQGEAASLGDMV